MANLSTIKPFDLYYVICQFLDTPDDLVHLSRTCKHIRYAIEFISRGKRQQLRPGCIKWLFPNGKQYMIMWTAHPHCARPINPRGDKRLKENNIVLKSLKIQRELDGEKWMVEIDQEYHSDGRIRLARIYEGSIPMGHIEYNKQGEILKRGYYENGKLAEERSYNSAGQAVAVTRFDQPQHGWDWGYQGINWGFGGLL